MICKICLQKKSGFPNSALTFRIFGAMALGVAIGYLFPAFLSYLNTSNSGTTSFANNNF